MLKKIVFNGLNSGSYTYTAIGEIYFYDSNGDVVDIKGSGWTTNNLTECENDNARITVTSTYNNSVYNIGNAFQVNHTHNGTGWYWLSSYDNQTITVILKKPFEIKSISFVPTMTWSDNQDRGIGENFQIIGYDNRDNVIATYDVTPITAIDTKQTIQTPDFPAIVYLLFSKPDNTVWYFDDTNTPTQLNSNRNNLTTSDFKSYGNLTAFEITKNDLQQLGNNFDVLCYSNDNLNKTVIEIVENPQIVQSKELLRIDDFSQIDRIEAVEEYQNNIIYNDENQITNATAESQYNSDNAPTYAIHNNDPTHGWGNNRHLPTWLQFELSEPKVVNKYKIFRSTNQVGNWGDGHSPKNWEIQGSNDGSTWTTLQTITNESIPNGTTKEFSFNNTTAYRYYRIYITAEAGSDSWINITYWELSYTGSESERIKFFVTTDLQTWKYWDGSQWIEKQIEFPVDAFGDGSVVRFYKFNNDTSDETSNNDTGIWHGNEQYEDGYIGKAAKFDGSSAIGIHKPVTQALYTITGWFKTNQVAHGSTYYNNPTIVGTGTNGNASKDFGLAVKDGYAHFWHGYYSSDISKTTDKYVSDDQWHFFAFVKDSSEVRVYIDNNPYDSLQCSTTQIGNETYWGMGAYISGSSFTSFQGLFKGLIDHIRIFNRILTESEIQQLYNEGSGLTLSDFDDSMTSTIMNNLTWNEWKLLFTEQKPDKIGFAFKLEDNPLTYKANLLELKITGTTEFYEDVSDTQIIKQNVNRFMVQFDSDGEFKINYLE